MMPESNSILPSPEILKVTAFDPPAASSMPTVARKRSLPPPRSIHTTLLAWVPTPWAKSPPAQRQRCLAYRAVDLRLAPTLLHLAQVEGAEPNGFRAAGAGRRQRQQHDDGTAVCCNSHRDSSLSCFAALIDHQSLSITPYSLVVKGQFAIYGLGGPPHPANNRPPTGCNWIHLARCVGCPGHCPLGPPLTHA